MDRKSATMQKQRCAFPMRGSLRGEKQNSVSKTLKVMRSVSLMLQNLDLVVAALCKFVGIKDRKRNWKRV